jgi:hypothetical protein
VPLEEALGRRQDAREIVAQVGDAAKECPAPFAADPVAGVVTRDRPRRGNRDHGHNRVVALGRKDARRDQRGLARQRHARRLEADQDEEQHEAVVEEELRHGPVECRRPRCLR